MIGQPDVANVCREICESIVALERAFESGELSSTLTSGRFEQALGPQLHETYGKLTNSAPGPLYHLRVDAVRVLLAHFQNDLSPTRIARAQVHMPAESDSSETEPWAESRPGLPFKLADAGFDGAPTTTLRFDQMLDARFWRVGFMFETRDLRDAFAQANVRSATCRLASDLLGLQRIFERFSSKTPKQQLRIVPLPEERRFERLILDILNQDDRHARMAPLVEDFLEKTDLRVKYPGFKRKRGARVQVTSTIAPEHHKTKLDAINRAEEFVFLSPLSLAEFVDFLQGCTPAGSILGLPSFALDRLWDCLEVKPIDVPQLAFELRRVMARALTKRLDSPLGPLAKVPLPIRQLIRLFVETHAIASTKRLRERERGNSRECASKENGVDEVDARNERRAEFLRALSAGDRIRGRVRNIVDYGAFIDLGCIDGLLHLTAIPGAVNGMIDEKLTEEEDVEVEVLKIDLEQQRISLGIPKNAADSE